MSQTSYTEDKVKVLCLSLTVPLSTSRVIFGNPFASLSDRHIAHIECGIAHLSVVPDEQGAVEWSQGN